MGSNPPGLREAVSADRRQLAMKATTCRNRAVPTYRCDGNCRIPQKPCLSSNESSSHKKTRTPARTASRGQCRLRRSMFGNGEVSAFGTNVVYLNGDATAHFFRWLVAKGWAAIPVMRFVGSA